ncbi:MAG: hypothetical protein ACTJGH_01235 [Peptoniphilaceae bacterium]
MDTTYGVMALFEFVRKAAFKLGFPASYSFKVRGGSDPYYTVVVRVPTVCAIEAKGAFNYFKEEYVVVVVFERIELATNVVCK